MMMIIYIYMYKITLTENTIITYGLINWNGTEDCNANFDVS